MSFRRLYTGQLERDKVAGNKIYSTKPSRDGFTDEPVTLAETKAHLVVTFEDDDTLITSLIKQCITSVEKHCNISILQKTVLVLADVYCEMELPYGPLLEFTSLELKTTPSTFIVKTLNTDYEIDGDPGDYARLIPRMAGRVRLTYKVGFGGDGIPDDLKLAVLNEIAFRYENRGDAAELRSNVNPGICESARVLAQPFIRMQWG